ncbi:MAG: phage integrase [Ewingella sp.]|uniref:phage integrase n=1 Tax=Ewingella TaxID=41201 RepID=UPI00336558D2
MTISKLESGQYLVDVRPQGRQGKRVRRRFDTRAEALQFERWTIAKNHNKEWIEKPSDKRPLSELIELWWKYHGKTLKSGAKVKQRMETLDTDLGNPRADQVNNKLFNDYRAARLEAGAKPSSVNRYQLLLSGVFNALIKAGQYHSENPIKDTELFKVNASTMSFLSRDDIPPLLGALNGDNLKVAKLCLATGARWSEAAGIMRDAVIEHKVTFFDTKNGKNRSVPISPVLYEEITSGKGRLLFPDANYNNMRSVLKRIIVGLPRGQASHVLRHTFATHFMMNGGNILTLQKILGHASIQQTMVYAHFAPEYLNDAVKLNPLEFKK